MGGKHGARLSQYNNDKRKIDKRKEAGLCARCGKNKVEKKLTCEVCLQKLRDKCSQSLKTTKEKNENK